MIHQAALAAYKAGLCILPTAIDGSKAPAIRPWGQYKSVRPSVAELRAWRFDQAEGFGIVAGAVSGCVECWDFDTFEVLMAFEAAAQAARLGAVWQRMTAGCFDRTPGGGGRIPVHYPPDITFTDCTLARRPGRAGESAIKTLIELPTFAIVAPSNGRTHPSGRAYERLSGDFATIAAYTADERAALMTLARTFDEMPRAERQAPAASSVSGGDRPGDDYNRRTTWPTLLEAHGWSFVFERNDVTYWRRPGKPAGVSATTNFGGADLFYPFTSSTEFEADKSYSKFGVLTLLDYAGDYGAAALALFKDGYGADPSDDTAEEAAEADTSPDPASSAGPTTPRTVRLIKADTMVLRPVRWLWADRLPLGAFALIGGREGIGKSVLVYTLAADITRGTLPGQFFGTPKSVIVAATEDSWEHTIAPRLLAAQADLSRVYRADIVGADGGDLPLSLPKDTAALLQAITDVDAALVIFDPLLSRLESRLDSHKDADVRRALEPLKAMADAGAVCVLGVIHVNKTVSSDALTLLMGSRAFVAVARAVLFVAAHPDEDEQRLLSQVKNNLGRLDLPTLMFRIRGALVQTTAAGEEVWTGQLEWQGESDTSIRDVLERVGERDGDRVAAREAAEWLVDFLTDQGGTVAAKIVLDKGREAGHSRATLYRARPQVGVQAEARGFPRSSYWMLPPSSRSTTAPSPDEVQSSQSSQSSHVSGHRDSETTSETPGGAASSRPSSQDACHLRRETTETTESPETTESQPLNESERRWRETDAAFKKGWQS
jgi:hypothetical protein